MMGTPKQKKTEAETLVYGWHAVAAVWANRPKGISGVWTCRRGSDPRSQAIISPMAAAGIAIHQLGRRDIDRMVEGANHQGIVIRCREATAIDWHELEARLDVLQEPPFLLVLDGVQDPHNFGACLRSAGAVGVHAVIIPKARSAPLSPVVRRVACGAAESVAVVQVSNLARTLRALKDRFIQVVGAAGEATESLYEAELTGPLAWVLGAEQHGLRRLTREQCDQLLSIPMGGAVESLNVSVATGICLFEAQRQRLATALRTP